MSVRAVGVPAEIQTEYLPNTEHMCYLPTAQDLLHRGTHDISLTNTFTTTVITQYNTSEEYKNGQNNKSGLSYEESTKYKLQTKKTPKR